MQRVRRDESICWEFDCQRLAGVWIWIVKRSAGTGDRYSNTMTLVEILAEPAYVECHFVDFVWLHKHFSLESLPIACAPNGIHDQNRSTIWVHVTHSHDKICVFGI